MAKSPILGGFSRSFSSDLSDNEAINLFVEIVETKDAKVPGALLLAAGLDLIGTLGTGPIRGAQKLQDTLYVVSGQQVYSLTANGVATMLGTVVDVGSPVSMMNNGQQMLIVDGVGAWLAPGGYPLTGGTITGATTNPANGATVNANGVAGGLYAVNDQITLKASSGTQSTYPILTVTSVANNPVTFYTLPFAGTTYGTTEGVATTAIQGQPGVGTGLILNLTASQGLITAASVASGGGGTGYAVGDTGIIGYGPGCYRVKAESGGVVIAVSVLVAGPGYGTETGVATTAGLAVPPNIGTGLTLDITATAGPITASTIANGGNNFVIGNVGYVTGGSGDATYLVTAVGATGAVTGFTITQGGTVNSPPLTFTQQSTTGSGAGFTLTSPVFGPFLGLVSIPLPFPNPLIGAISDGFGVMIFQGQQYIAASNELDLSTWGALSYGIADQSPDNTMSVVVFHDEAYVLKEKESEVWVDGGLANFPFQPLSGVHMEYGCVAPFSPAIAGSMLIWLSRNEQGQGIVVATGGYDPQPISTQALIAEFDTYANIGDAIGYARQQGGHVFYVLTFPEADKTWAYDVTASQMAGVPLWHRLASFANGQWHRHLGNCFTPWRGAVTLVTNTAVYQPNSVMIAGEELETASGLNGLPLSFSTAVFSVWLDLPDGTTATGIAFSNQGTTANPGISISIQNDQTGTPQIAVEAWDAGTAPIVSATYDFTAWSAWTNILISLDTATQALQVWANTVSDEAVVESELTATSITWASSNPIAPSSGAPFHLTAGSGTVFPIAGIIAQLVVPSDTFGTPIGAAIDWVRGKVFLWNSSASGAGTAGPSARIYSVELTTQNPILSAAIDNDYVAAPAVDPASGSLIVVTTAGNGCVLNKYDPATLANTGTFGVGQTQPRYPTQLQPTGSVACVGVGTLASGGGVQVGYAVAKDADNFGWVAVVRLDNMTAAGFMNPAFVSNASSNFALLCSGPSGSDAGAVFLVDTSGASTAFISSIKLYAVTISAGAETYNIASWPTANPYITGGAVGSIAATEIDATATGVSSTQIGYDAVNNIVVLDVITNGTVTPRALIGVNPATAAIIWQTAVTGVTDNLSSYSINGEIVALESSTGSPPVGGSAVVINTGTGALTTTTLNGVVPTFAAGSDITGLMVLNTAFTEGAGSPTPAGGTPSTFVGFAIMSGAKEPPHATVADLWFGQTAGFVDFTVASNRRNFISSAGGAQSLGSDGSAPFGVAPPVFLSNSGMPASFASNAGRGGAFVVSGGILSAGASNPPPSSQTTTTTQQNSPGDGVLGDYASGNLYAFNPKKLTDNGTQRRWLRRWRAVEKASMAAQRFGSLAIQVQTGVGVPDGADPQVILRWSDDGGKTWSHERILAVGQLGDTAATIKFNRLGATRRFGGSDRIFELSSSDPFLTAIIDAEVDLS